MKLIKLMLAGIVVMAFSFGQDQTQDGGQPPQGPPPCDPNATYPVADPGPDGGCGNYADCNGNGAYDLGEPCFEDGQDGGPPFEAVDTNGDGVVDREEARAMFGHDEEGNADPEFDAEYDRIAGDDGVVDHDEYMAAGDDGGGTCDVCGHEYGGSDDHHGHCDKCDFVFTSDNDQHGHCDQCDYVFSGEGDRHGHCDKCDHIYNSDDDRHGHCDHEGCDFVGNSDADWQNHHHDDGGGDHGDGGGPPPNNHWDGNCGALCSGMGDYYLDSDGDGNAEDGPYATWDHDADGNPVDCGCAGDDGDHDGDEGDHDDQGGQCRYEGCDFVGSTDDDWRGHCDANPDHCRPQAGDTCGYGHDGDEACDYVFTGDEGEDHHHCDTCGVAMSSGQDMDQHCQDNPEHCRPRAGDTCECGFTFAGTDADENHRHCPTCNAQFDNDGDMGQHCQDNEGHCGDNNDQN